MIDRDDLECRIAREESRHQAGIGTCSLALQIGFFFDGLKRNINVDEESQRLTNVGRLFRAHPEIILAEPTSSYSYAKVYIPGLATPLTIRHPRDWTAFWTLGRRRCQRIMPMRWLNRAKKRRSIPLRAFSKGTGVRCSPISWTTCGA